MNRKPPNETVSDPQSPPAAGPTELSGIVDALVESIHAEPKLRHLNRVHLPNRDRVVRAVDLLRQLVFPGYFGKQELTSENLPYHVGEVVVELRELLFEQIRCCLRYRENLPPDARGDQCDACDREAEDVVARFFARLSAVRTLLSHDVQAAFDGDPAARSTDETIFCYPGLLAIAVQRLAHELYAQDVPLLPRMMTEWAHGRTGIDIHPGAELGKGLMIDHGTGVVIGETTLIGENVKIYQGVTLGALAPAFGQLLRGQKRHPTIEDDVTIYAGATILGGETVIGRGAVIGGNVFVTSSVPAMNVVTAETPKLHIRDRRPGKRRGKSSDDTDAALRWLGDGV